MLEIMKDYWFLITFGIGIFGGAWKGIATLNETLLSIKHQLEVSNTQHQFDVNVSIEDRKRIWIKVNEHDGKIDSLDKDVARQSEQLKTLFKER